MQEIESALTEPVSVDGANVTVEELRRASAPRTRSCVSRAEARSGWWWSSGSGNERKTFDRLPVIVRGRPAELTPKAVSVEVAGPARVLRDLSPDDVRPYVNVAPDHDRSQPLPVAVEIASGHTGADVVQTEPAEVEARLLPAGKSRP